MLDLPRLSTNTVASTAVKVIENNIVVRLRCLIIEIDLQHRYLAVSRHFGMTGLF